MDGDQDGTQDQAASQPESGSVKAPDTRKHQGITESQPSISEKALVDRIDRSDFWMIVLTAVIAFSGIVSAIIFGWQLAEMRATRIGNDATIADQMAIMREQAKAMQGQLDQMAVAQRPWVVLVNIEPTNLTSDNEVGVILWVKMTIKNTGHSPAQNVSVSADLLIDNFDPRPDQGVVSACEKGRTGSWVIPGRPVFPDQVQNIDGDATTSFMINSSRVWAARAARIQSIYDNRIAHGDRERAQEWADAIAKFPFYAQIFFVGCINYRSADNTILYQTSFMFDVGEQNTSTRFPLLSEENPVSSTPTPMPGDSDGAVIQPRMMQRTIPGDKVKLGALLYGTFAN